MFERIFADLPDGACWINGKRLKQLAQLLEADRARLPQTQGSEMGTPFGRFLFPDKSLGIGAYPFEVLHGSGAGDASNWVKVNYNSWLLKDANPTSKITITGLDTSFQISAGQRIWLEVNLSATYSMTPGPITASIQHGTNWGVGKSYYPIPVEYDTDDGTRLSSGGTPPDNTKQMKFFIPIAYATTKEIDDFSLVAKGYAITLGEDLFLIQQCFSHLMIGGACIDGGQVIFAIPSLYAPQPS